MNIRITRKLSSGTYEIFLLYIVLRFLSTKVVSGKKVTFIDIFIA